MGTEFQFRKVKHLGDVRVAQQCEYTYCHQAIQLNMVKIVCCDIYHNETH